MGMEAPMSDVASTTQTENHTPALTVVVASVNGWEVLGPTMEALDAQPERDRMEILVVDVVGGSTHERLRDHRPGVVLIPVEERLPIPRLRYLGVRRAR